MIIFAPIAKKLQTTLHLFHMVNSFALDFLGGDKHLALLEKFQEKISVILYHVYLATD